MITPIALASFPSGAMLLCTLVGLGIHVPRPVAGALQHFAAGILLCAIGTELLPAMANASGWIENLCAGAGFFAGVAAMLTLGVLFPEEEEEGEENGDHDAGDIRKTAPQDEWPKETRDGVGGRNDSARRRRSSIIAQASHAHRVMEKRQSSIVDQARSHARTTMEMQPLTSGNGADVAPPESAFPSALLAAIAIDGGMDGLLIGIATAAGPSAGPMMAASLCVEMGFLGLTLSIALRGLRSRAAALMAALVGPAAIALGAAAGGALAGFFEADPLALTFLLSFGTSALLFMVAEELLLEAHEGGGHVWWVDLQLYTGFFASIVMGELLKD